MVMLREGGVNPLPPRQSEEAKIIGATNFQEVLSWISLCVIASTD